MNERGDILVARPQRALGSLPAGAAGAKSALLVAPATAAAMPGGAWPEELQVGAWRGGHGLIGDVGEQVGVEAHRRQACSSSCFCHHNRCSCLLPRPLSGAVHAPRGAAQGGGRPPQ